MPVVNPKDFLTSRTMNLSLDRRSSKYKLAKAKIDAGNKVTESEKPFAVKFKFVQLGNGVGVRF